MIVQVLLAEQAVAADGQAGIAGEDDNRVRFEPRLAQRVQNAADLGIEERDEGVVVREMLPHNGLGARPGRQAFIAAFACSTSAIGKTGLTYQNLLSGRSA